MPEHDPERFTRRRLLSAAALLALGAAGGHAAEFLLATASPGQPAGTSRATPAGASPGALAGSVPSPTPAVGDGAPTSGVATRKPSSSTASSSAQPSLAPDQGRWHYRSRPDLTPPIVEVAVHAAAAAPGLILFTPGNGAGTDGPTIVDATGEPVWIRPGTGRQSANLAVQRLFGRRVLTWWEGTVNGGNGDGEFVIADTTYREIQRVHAQNGYHGDLHEFQITPRGTALFLAGNWNVAPPAAAGSTMTSPVLDDVVQEVDLRSGNLVFEWHAADDIDLSESVVDPPSDASAMYDYVHTNSIDVDTDGNLLVSARNTSAIYKIDRQSGRLRWRLGGKRSDFAMADGATFGYQHDARRRPDGTISLFDDETNGTTSRGLVLTVDERAMTASVARSYARPNAIQSSSQGSAQLLPNGNWFVGWGSSPFFTEFAPDGSVVFDAAFAAGAQSYRSVRSPWVGRPSGVPAVAAQRAVGSTVVYASWNGATELAAWEVLAGPSASRLAVVATAARMAFETAITIPGSPAFVAVRALDPADEELGLSESIPVV